jgi:hypothetical protein
MKQTARIAGSEEVGNLRMERIANQGPHVCEPPSPVLLDNPQLIALPLEIAVRQARVDGDETLRKSFRVQGQQPLESGAPAFLLDP